MKKAIQKRALRLNALCPYFTRFPLRFPLARLRNARQGDWVLDPFCGCGTALFAARLRGLGAVGIDANPVASAIARAKQLRVSVETVTNRAREILESGTKPIAPPEGLFWRLCYGPHTLKALCRFREHFMSRPDSDVDIMLCALLLGLLHGPPTNSEIQGALSNVLPAAFAPSPETAVACWEKNDCRPVDRDVSAAIAARAEYVLRSCPPLTPGAVHEGDSRHIPLFSSPATFDWVITSPPYFGLDGFAAHQWLRQWLLGGPAEPSSLSHGQISHQGMERFLGDLADVWRNVATACRPGAHLVIRFGGVPGVTEVAPATLLKTSLKRAAVPWQVKTLHYTREAFVPEERTTPFTTPSDRPTREFELFARFEP